MQINLGMGVEEFRIKDSKGGGRVESVAQTRTAFDTDTNSLAALNILTAGTTAKIVIEENVHIYTTKAYGIRVWNKARYYKWDEKELGYDLTVPVQAELYIYGTIEVGDSNGKAGILVEGDQHSPTEATNNIKLFIDKANISCKYGSAIEMHAGELTINGGTFHGMKGLVASKLEEKTDAIKVTLNGGKFTGQTVAKAIEIGEGVEKTIATIVQKEGDQ